MATLVCSKPYTTSGASEVRAYAANVRLYPFSFVASASYVTGGDTILPADMPSGYKDLLDAWSVSKTGGYSWKLDVPNSKLLAYGTPVAGAAEITAGTNLTTAAGAAAITIYFLVR